MSDLETSDAFVEIRPTSNVFATYRRLSYKPWYAVAEFVDNSTQSFFDHEGELGHGGESAQLEVRIYHDKAAATFTVADNAYGMTLEDFKRAVQLNRPPVGEKTRNEFGMGLKTAACWMGARWTVRSKALGSTVEYRTTVDVEELAENAPETLAIHKTSGLDPTDHYTVITVEGMYRLFHTRTTGRIKELLGSMYRRDLASGHINIYWNDDPLTWDTDPMFVEKLPNGVDSIDWKTDLDFQLSTGEHVTGWAMIRLPGNARRAGLHLFRQGRIIVGGPGEGWKPHELYGAPNSFASQRLVGELNLDHWPVTQAKDGFDWDGGPEEELIGLLRQALQPLIEKASGRLREDGDPSGPQPSSADAALAVDTLAGEVSLEALGSAVEFFEEQPLILDATPEEQSELVAAAEATGAKPTLTAIGSAGVPTVKWWLLDQEHPAEAFMRIAMPQPDDMHIFVNLRHPFVEEHVGSDQAQLGLYLKFLLAEALVDRTVTRRPETVSMASIRRFKDTFLRNLPGDM